MSRYFQPRWAYLSPSVSTTSYFGGGGAGFALRTPGPLAGLQDGGSRAADSPARPGRAAGVLGRRVEWGGRTGRLAGARGGAPHPLTPLNLCPESVSARCGSLYPWSPDECVFFRINIISRARQLLGVGGRVSQCLHSSSPTRPAHGKLRKGQSGAEWRLKPATPPHSGLALHPCAKGERAPTIDRVGVGRRGRDKPPLNAKEVKLWFGGPSPARD